MGDAFAAMTLSCCNIILDPVPDGDGAEKGSFRRADGKMLPIDGSNVFVTKKKGGIVEESRHSQ